MSNLYRCDFQVRALNAAGKSGPADQYRLPVRTAMVSAASEGGVQAVLNADISLRSGETVHVLSVQPISVGTEGSGILT